MRFHAANFHLQPHIASVDFAQVRLFVEPALAARLPLEVLYGIGYEDLVALECRRIKAQVKYPARRSYEGMATQILFIARLFADKHDSGITRPFARDGSRGVLPQIAAPAVLQLVRDVFCV
jgi:hypothetical protein